MAKLILKSFFFNLCRISEIILYVGVSSGIIWMFCHIVDDVGCYGKLFFSP